MVFPSVPYAGFRRGDLVYGLANPRFDYSKKYPFFAESDSTRNISTIDQYAMTSDEVFFKERVDVKVPDRQGEFFESVAQHSKYKSILDTKSIPIDYRKQIFFDNDETAIGRKVKAGLNWAKDSQTRVHFVLDDIDMNEVVNKTLRVVGKRSTRPYTGSELRWLYRNRHDPDVQNVVQFWQDGKHVEPPWETDRELWKRYEPKNERTSMAQSKDFDDETMASTSKELRVARHASDASKPTHDVDDFFELFALFDFL
ncbi:hypothetical protein [Ochrobactrum vermis]|nr:hypothetical protein [Ochrobactrum vermis]